MSDRIVHFDGRRHAEAERLLPWLVNGRLDDDERGWVELHVAGCSQCRSEVDALRSLQQSWRQADATRADVGAVDAGWRRMRAQLPRPAHASHAAAIPWRQRRSRWLGWGLAAQAAVIAVLAIALWRQPSAPAYHTLGATPPASNGNLVVMFDPQLDEARMRGLLRASDARIVDGPNDAGAYVLAVPQARVTQVRDALRSAPGVMLVATLGPDGRQ